MPTDVPHAHAALMAVLAGAFRELDVTVSLQVGRDWFPIHVVEGRTAQSFEAEHGVQELRYHYNARMLSRLQRNQRTELGEHAGFFDLFVPVGDGGRTWGALVAGGFARTRPTDAEILSRWR